MAVGSSLALYTALLALLSGCSAPLLFDRVSKKLPVKANLATYSHNNYIASYLVDQDLDSATFNTNYQL